MNSPEYTVKAPVMGPEIMCSGFVVCSRPASTNPQFATGPQKCVVFGPVGELMNFMSADDIAAAPEAVQGETKLTALIAFLQSLKASPRDTVPSAGATTEAAP